MSEKCTKCKENPRTSYHRWCRKCLNAYLREWRVRQILREIKFELKQREKAPTVQWRF